MGLLQEIEGLFGFGKKANQTSQNQQAVSAAITAVQGATGSVQKVVDVLTPFADENPVFKIAIGAATIVLTDFETVLGWLASLVPKPAAPPAPPPTAPPTS